MLKHTLEACVLAKRAYHVNTVNKDGLTKEEFKGFFNINEFELKTFTVEHDYSFVVNDQKKLVISIRGSDDRKDWFSNFLSLKADPKKTNIQFEAGATKEEKNTHLGFLYSWKIMKKVIEPYLNEKIESLPNDVKIIVTGHSRGGALANLCAEFVAKKYGKETELYTYGSPRVGTQAYKAVMRSISNLKMVRIRNRKDVVPDVPLKSFGYVHCCSETNVGKTFGDRINPFPPFTKKQILTHHRDNSYIRSIKEAKKKGELP